MGREVCRAVEAETDLELAALIDVAGVSISEIETGGAGSPPALSNVIEGLEDAQVDVAVDFTHAGAGVQNIKWCVLKGIAVVVGTSGIGEPELSEIAELCAGNDGHVLIAPNFAIGAVLAIRFSELAAAWLPDAEIVELHHEGKIDSPSGTAIKTAQTIALARKRAASPAPSEAPGPVESRIETLPGARGADLDGVRIHSVRLPGLVAHQEVIFGGKGQTLSIRHDSVDRSSFMPGVILAVRQIRNHPGLTIGLENLLGL
jgi:4-hydroxy-tetrahydrodipicolinate reductase